MSKVINSEKSFSSTFLKSFKHKAKSCLFHRVVASLKSSSAFCVLVSISFLLAGCNIEGSLKDLAGLLKSNVAAELSSGESRITNSQEIPVQLSFSTEVLDLVTKDFFQITGGSIKDDLITVIVPGRVFSFILVPSISQGSVSVRFPLQAVSVHSNSEKTEIISRPTSSSSLTFVVDQEEPTVSLSTTVTSPTDVATIPVSVVFSESVTGLSADDFSLTSSGGGLASITGFSGSGSVYQMTITPIATGLIELELPLGAVKDLAGNGNRASNKLSVFYDATIPVPTISSTVTGPTNVATLPITIDFGSVSVTGLEASDFQLSAGSILNLAGSGSSYTLTLQTPLVDGTVTLQLPAGTVENSFGSRNVASNLFSIVIDRASLGNPAPQLAVSSPSPSSGSKDTSFVWSIDYTGAATVTLDKDDISFEGTATAGCDASVSSSGNPRLVTVSGCTSDGTMRIKVAAGTAADGSGFLSAASDNAAAVTVDNTGPALSMTGPVPTLGNSASTFRWTVTYGSDATDITLTDTHVGLTGTATADCAATVSSAAGVFYVDVTDCSAEGTLGISLAAGTAKDTHGNLALAATSSGQGTVRNTGPGLTISSPTPEEGNSSTSFVWDLIYTSAETIHLSSTTVSTYLELTGASAGCALAVTSPNGQTRRVTVTECTGNGNLGLSVKAESAADEIGNFSLGATGADVLVDNTGPGLAVGSPSPALGNHTAVFEWLVSYTDAADISLSADNVTVGGGASAGCTKTVTGSGLLQRKISVTGCTADGNMGISIAAGTAVDSLGNPAAAATLTPGVVVDNTPPSIALEEPIYEEGYSTDKLVWEVTYTGASEVSLEVADVLPQGDSVGCVFTVEGSGTATRSVSALGCTGHTTVGIKIAAGSAKDSAGNVAGASELSETVKLLNPVKVNFASATQALNKTSGASTHSIPVTLEKALPVDVTIPYQLLSFTTAVNPTDFNIPAMGNVVIPAGQTTANIDYTYMGTTGSKIIQLALEPGISQGYNLSTAQGIHRRIIRDNGVKDFDYTKISAGTHHSCGITQAGVLRCWGLNTGGQLGNGTNISSSEPVNVSGGGTYESVSAGGSGTCAIRTGGSLRCWGAATFLGTGATVASNVPVVVGSGYANVSVSSTHVCAVTTSGALQCWGQSSKGNVRSSDGIYYTPQTIASSGYQSVSTGGAFFWCAITTAGGIHCQGQNGPGHLGNGSDANSATPVVVAASGYKSLSSGHQHTCAVTTAGGISCWGSNALGTFGDGTSTSSNIPVTVASSGYESVSAGSSHTCAITTGAKNLRCWGWNSSGQLGVETTTQTIVEGSGYSVVSAGGSHTCAIRMESALRTTYCWGRASEGQLANGMTLSGEQEILDGPFQYVSVSDRQSCAITTDHRLKCWGLGNLGIGSGYTPVLVGNGYKNVSIGGSSSASFRCAITLKGALRCWGRNNFGQLGIGNKLDAETPVTLATSGYKYVVAGVSHACALTEDGDVKCWGRNSYGQLGNGTTTESLTPVTVASGIKSLSAGSYTTCVISNAGVLSCWGNNQYQLLGNTIDLYSSTPVVIGNYDQVSVGKYHICATRTNGALYCWGYNTSGQLGTDDTVSTSSPTLVAASGYTSVSAGENHTCGTATNGSLRCWGNNQYRQRGDADGTLALTPIVVRASGYAGAQLSTSNHTCAVRSDGRLFCWGDNQYSQLGDGHLRLTPVPIRP